MANTSTCLKAVVLCLLLGSIALWHSYSVLLRETLRDVVGATSRSSLVDDDCKDATPSLTAGPVGASYFNSSAGNSSLALPSTSLFTQARDVVYGKIAQEEQERIRTRTVKGFDLATWTRRTDGGLMDEDRRTLAGIYAKANSVFEFGLGESTYIADYLQVPRYSGVDSDAVWVNMCRANVSSHFRFYYADIGQTKYWGYPTRNLVKNVADYQITPLEAEPFPFDVYMVDGRWRFPLLMLSFLHAAERGADRAHTTVLLHDCWQEGYSDLPKPRIRGVYRAGDHLLDLVDHSGKKLCVYKRKASTSDEQILAMWKEHHANME